MMDRPERHDRRDGPPGCKVFVGDLNPSTQERDVEEIFAKYGQLRNCFVARAPGKEELRGPTQPHCNVDRSS